MEIVQLILVMIQCDPPSFRKVEMAAVVTVATEETMIIMPRGSVCRSSSRGSVLGLCPLIRRRARSEHLILTLAVVLMVRIWQSGRGHTFIRAMSRYPSTPQRQTPSRHGR